MADSDDENVLYAPTGKDFNHQGKGLLGNGVKNVNDILNGPSDNRRLKKTIALCAAFMGLGLALAVVGPTLRELQNHLQVDFPHISYIFTGRSIGYVIGSIIGGMTFETFHPLMLIGLTLGMSGVGLLVTPFCRHLMSSVLAISFVGVAMGALDTGANVVCLRMWGKKSAPFMQALHFSFALGAFIAPLLAGPFMGPVPTPSLSTTLSPVTNSSVATSFTMAVIVQPSASEPEGVEMSGDGSPGGHNDSGDPSVKKRDTFFEDGLVDREMTEKRQDAWKSRHLSRHEDVEEQPKFHADDDDVALRSKRKKRHWRSQIMLEVKDDNKKTKRIRRAGKAKTQPQPTTEKPSKKHPSVEPPKVTSIHPTTAKHSKEPSTQPSSVATSNELKTVEPPNVPSTQSPTAKPSKEPSTKPSAEELTTVEPPKVPSTQSPTAAEPSKGPSTQPLAEGPSKEPTTVEPSKEPPKVPSTQPPTAKPSKGPSTKPSTEELTTVEPPKVPSTQSPTAAEPSKGPLTQPLAEEPSKEPTTVEPSKVPSTQSPSAGPSTQPLSVDPSNQPPSMEPSKQPPTEGPSKGPSTQPPAEELSALEPSKQPPMEDPSKEQPAEGGPGAPSTVTTSNHFQGVYVIIGVYLIFMALVFGYFFCTSPAQFNSASNHNVSEANYKPSEKNFTYFILGLLFLFYFLYVGGEVGYGSFIYSFATDSKTEVNFDKNNATQLNSLFWGTFALGRGVSICIASIISPLNMILLDLVGCIVSSMALAYEGDTNAVILWVGTATLGASMASLFPAGISWMESHAPVTGSVASLLIIGAAFGEMAVPLVLGNLFVSDVGPMSLMYVMLAITLSTAGIFGGTVYLAASEGRSYDPLPKEDVLEDLLTEVKCAIDDEDEPSRSKQATKPFLPKPLQKKKHKE